MRSFENDFLSAVLVVDQYVAASPLRQIRKINTNSIATSRGSLVERVVTTELAIIIQPKTTIFATGCAAFHAAFDTLPSSNLDATCPSASHSTSMTLYSGYSPL